jgi:hypothetical protein
VPGPSSRPADRSADPRLASQRRFRHPRRDRLVEAPFIRRNAIDGVRSKSSKVEDTPPLPKLDDEYTVAGDEFDVVSGARADLIPDGMR